MHHARAALQRLPRVAARRRASNAARVGAADIADAYNIRVKPPEQINAALALDDDDAAIIAQFWTEDARVPVHAVSQSVYSVVFCEPIERLIIDRFGPKEVRPCTKKRFEELQEKGLHNHIWD